MKLTVIKNLGAGGFGIVDKVRDEEGHKYARKTFSMSNPGFSSSLVDHAKERFKREVKYQSEIKHQNIVPIIYADVIKEPPYYLMPLADASLADDILESRDLNGDYLEAIMDIIAALEEIHSIGIYHRDLKPANVLRFTDGDDSYYAISDFGLMAIEQTRVSTLTQTGMRMGSDYYTAPEIVRDLKKASVRSDIYSLGCILHDFIGTEERIPCNEIREAGPFSGLLLGCTRKDPARRFKSVSAVRDALLSLEDVDLKPKGKEAAAYYEMLGESDLTVQQCTSIVEFIEDTFPNPDAIACLTRLSLDQIDTIFKTRPELASRLGTIYAVWVRDGSFNFERCDGLAMRLQKFIDNCEIEVQAECLMAMLYMGTSHNRYYVERKFVGQVGKKMDPFLAKRLSIEFSVDEERLCEAISHLKGSIDFDVSSLHLDLRHAIKRICR